MEAKPESPSTTDISPFLSLHDWANQLAHAEQSNGALSLADIRELVGRASLKFIVKRREFPDNCNLYVKGLNLDDPSAKPTVVGNGEGACRLPFFGRVLTLDLVKRVPRATLIPIGGGGDGNAAPRRCSWMGRVARTHWRAPSASHG